MKVLITAGGGGHFSSALAVLEKLQSLGHDIFFVGRKYTFEGDTAEPYEIQVVKEKKIPYGTIDAARLQRKITKHTIPSLMKLPNNLWESRSFLLSYAPDVVVSFGGTVTLPIVFAASRMRIPVVIHEQSIQGGIANKVGARFASAVCLSWDESRRYFKNNHITVTGFPLRDAVYKADSLPMQKRKEMLKKMCGFTSEKPVLYITGGSSGSHMLNLLIEEALPELLQDYILIHQTGDASEFQDFNRLAERKQLLDGSLQNNYFLKKFVTADEAALFLSTADMVISRSGMGTTSELIFFQKKALLFPLQLIKKSEQLINAAFYVNLRLGDYVPAEKATKETLLKKIPELLVKKPPENSERLGIYKKRFLLAADTIVTTIITYAEKKATDQAAPKRIKEEKTSGAL